MNLFKKRYTPERLRSDLSLASGKTVFSYRIYWDGAHDQSDTVTVTVSGDDIYSVEFGNHIVSCLIYFQYTAATLGYSWFMSQGGNTILIEADKRNGN